MSDLTTSDVLEHLYRWHDERLTIPVEREDGTWWQFPARLFVDIDVSRAYRAFLLKQLASEGRIELHRMKRQSRRVHVVRFVDRPMS